MASPDYSIHENTGLPNTITDCILKESRYVFKLILNPIVFLLVRRVGFGELLGSTGVARLLVSSVRKVLPLASLGASSLDKIEKTSGSLFTGLLDQ